jgi:hypothetical protein
VAQGVACAHHHCAPKHVSTPSAFAGEGGGGPRAGPNEPSCRPSATRQVIAAALLSYHFKKVTEQHGGPRVLEVGKHVGREAADRVQVPRHEAQNRDCGRAGRQRGARARKRLRTCA